MKRLGVTHIQLMPAYDYGSVDESKESGEFNWGYDPVNYNVPEAPTPQIHEKERYASGSSKR